MLVITTDLRTDGGTQPRGRLDNAVVERYAEEMEAGLWDFSKSSAPIVTFYDGTDHWLADGFHRVAAAKKARLDALEVDVRQGGQRDADPLLGRRQRDARPSAVQRRQAARGVPPPR